MHGRRGGFLASLAVLSLLSVTSHHEGHNSHNTIAAHGGEVLARNTPSRPEQRFLTFNHGTRVMVKDLFGSMAVRVKQRALAAEKPVAEREWSNLVRAITALLLGWPAAVLVAVREPRHQFEMRLKTAEVEERDLYRRVSGLVAQGRLSDAYDSRQWVPVTASSGNLRIQGCICLVPAPSRRAQFISLGIEPITNDWGSNVLYEAVNKLFAASNFALELGDDAAQTQDGKSKRSLERWPMFYFKIMCGRGSSLTPVDDLLDGRSHSLDTIITMLRRISFEFLNEHGFHPAVLEVPAVSRNVTPPSRTASVTVQKRPLHRARNLLDAWQTIKIGDARHRVLGQKSDLGRAESDGNSDNMSRPEQSAGAEQVEREKRAISRLVAPSGKLLRKPFADVDLEPASAVSTPIRPRASLSEAEKERQSKVDSRLLVSQIGCDHCPSASTSVPALPIHHSQEARSAAVQPSEWLTNFLEGWENPVFPSAEPAIPRSYDDLPANTLRAMTKSQGRPGSVSFETSLIGIEGRISKDGLGRAEVISQVDNKFILVNIPLELEKVPPAAPDAHTSPTLLAIVDQHAADERCRLEALMASYFDPESADLIARTEVLDAPARFEVSRQEASLLRRFATHFEKWGVHYDVITSGRSKLVNEIQVQALPFDIAERCRQEPKLVIDFLRREIWKLDEGTILSTSVQRDTGLTQDWIARFQGCPEGILELLNSRACRSEFLVSSAA